MPAILLVARLVLAAVFAIAAAAKLTDLPGSRQTMRDFGVPERLVGPAARLLPACELLLALGLLPSATAPWAAAGAFALLVVFIAAIAVALGRGKRPSCHCFGKLSAAPIGRATLARNVALAGLAAIVVVAGRTPLELTALSPLVAAPPWALMLGIWAACLTVVALFQGWLLLHLLRQHGRLLLRLDQATAAADGAATQPADGLPIHTPAPALTFTTLDGQPATLTALLTDERPAVLLFIDPHCGPCNELLPEARAWRQQFAHLFHLVAVSSGDAASNRAKTRGLAHVWLPRDGDALGAFRVSGTPSAVVVAPDGRIASATAAGAEAIRQLVAATTAAASAAALPAADRDTTKTVGASAPELTHGGSDGAPFDWAQPNGRASLVLFWNPQCGYCQRIAADMQRWAAQADPRAVRLVVVTSGDVHAARALSPQAEIITDPEFRISALFGASGTPSAVLVDAHGRVGSKLAVGTDEVLALARSLRLRHDPQLVLQQDRRGAYAR